MYAIVLLPFLSALRDTFRGRAVLQLELLALRHQLATLERTSPRLSLRSADRLLWVILSRILPNWREVLLIGVGSSSAPSPGSTVAGASPRTMRASTEPPSPSFVWPASDLCCEGSPDIVIHHELSGGTLREEWLLRAAKKAARKALEVRHLPSIL
jgi:hypothetical protein